MQSENIQINLYISDTTIIKSENTNVMPTVLSDSGITFKKFANIGISVTINCNKIEPIIVYATNGLLFSGPRSGEEEDESNSWLILQP